MKIYDTHAHLDHVENLETALKDADQVGVVGIICVSMDVASSQKNLEIKRKFKSPKIYLAMGMHPSEAKLSDLDNLKKLIIENKNELTAVGEIGLDFSYKWVRKDQVKRNEQRQVFAELLKMAVELDLPAIIHSRGMEQECLDTAKKLGVKKGIFHWYSGPVDVLKKIMDEGYFVSTSPSVAYSPPSREAMTHAAIEQTLIETDSPVNFKNPTTEESFISEPKDVFRTLKAYASLKNISEEKAAEQLNRNTISFFNLEKGLS